MKFGLVSFYPPPSSSQKGKHLLVLDRLEAALDEGDKTFLSPETQVFMDLFLQSDHGITILSASVLRPKVCFLSFPPCSLNSLYFLASPKQQKKK